MNRKIILSFLGLLFLFSCKNNKQDKVTVFKLTDTVVNNKLTDTIKEKNIQVFIKGEWQSFILGDINNDQLIDTAFVYTPAYYATKYAEFKDEPPMFDSCIDNNCYNVIRFSCNLPEIIRKNSLWGGVERIDDLDEDGINEIVFETGWYIGTHCEIYIYSFDKLKGKWIILAKNYRYEDDNYYKLIKKVDKTKFKFKVEYMDTIIAHDIQYKNIIVHIKK